MVLIGSIANILLAIDDRVKNSVLNIAGLEFQRDITIPVLMVNGKFDQFFD